MLSGRRKQRTLDEACRCAHVWALTGSRRQGLDKAEDDHVKSYEDFRRACPDYHKPGHAAFCERCDNSYPSKAGGADYLREIGVRETNPFEKFPQPLEPPVSSGEIHPPDKLNEGKSSQNHARIRLAAANFAAKIEESPRQELSVREDEKMSDYVRDLLRMSSGGALGGRNKLSLPDELMDALAGDAAQEAIMKDKVLTEMRNKGNPERYHADFIALDAMLYEGMEKGEVDEFLKSARKKIIKRSKATRKACCLRIGGVLDQLMGPAGGEWADKKPAKDRGEDDPIGEEEFDKDVLAFVAEEFNISEHDSGCPLAQVLWEDLSEEQKFIQKSVKKPGALRSHFGVERGDQLPVAEAEAKCSELQEKAENKKLSEGESKLLKRLQLFLKVLKPTTESGETQETQEVTTQTEANVASETANALASFMEASHTGSVGDLHPTLYDGAKKTRDDRKEYPTELRRRQGAESYDSGKPHKAKDSKKHTPRYEKNADPIGEGENTDNEQQISETANAVAAFLEAAHTGQTNWPHGSLTSPKAYDDPHTERSDNKQDYLKTGGEAAKGEFPFGKHRFDKGVGDKELPGAATSKQLTRP